MQTMLPENFTFSQIHYYKKMNAYGQTCQTSYFKKILFKSYFLEVEPYAAQCIELSYRVYNMTDKIIIIIFSPYKFM